jgi:hypothetical protein
MQLVTNKLNRILPTLMYLHIYLGLPTYLNLLTSLPTYLLKFLDYLALGKWIGSSLIMVFKSIIHFMVMVSLTNSTNPLKCLQHFVWTHEIGQNTFEINPLYKLKLWQWNHTQKPWKLDKFDEGMHEST